MKVYQVKNENSEKELLEITAESELGFHVKITSFNDTGSREYRDFISRNLFEALIQSGYLQEMAEHAFAC